MKKFTFWYKTEIKAKDILEAVFIEAKNKKVADFYSITEDEEENSDKEIGFKCH